MDQIFAIISSGLLMIIGLWKYFGRKNKFKREQADKAGEDLENAKTNDSESDFLDGFSRL